MKDSNVRETEKEVSKINSDLYGYDQEVSKMIKEETSALPKQARDIVQSKAEKLKK
jgi:hypothetical protein